VEWWRESLEIKNVRSVLLNNVVGYLVNIGSLNVTSLCFQRMIGAKIIYVHRALFAQAK
jgi:hypothetical protein